MTKFISSKEHAKILRTYLKGKFPELKWSVRTSRYGNLTVKFDKSMKRDKIRALLESWKTGEIGCFDNRINFRMVLTKEDFPRIISEDCAIKDGIEDFDCVCVFVNYISFTQEE